MSSKPSAMVYGMVGIVVILIGLSIFLWVDLENLQRERERESETYSSEFQHLRRELQETTGELDAIISNYMGENISLSFVPYQKDIGACADSIIYLMGFVTVSNLDRIEVRPITVKVTFTPQVKHPQSGTLTYDYTREQTLEVKAPELDVISFPWGAFPICLANFTNGDRIIWNMHIRATVTWGDHELSTTEIYTTFTLTVVE